MTVPTLTDRAALERNRARARARGLADFLHVLARDEIKERLDEVNRRFTSPALISGFPEVWGDMLPFTRIVPDAERLDLGETAHDLVIHAMALHWADDPIGQLVQCRRALKPDGLLLVVGFGGRTLAELRACLAQAEAEITGGLSPRVAPMAELRDLGSLLQRAGLALPVADTLPKTVSYKGFLPLLHDLRAMGEGNALADRLRHPTRPSVMARAAELYAEHHGDGDRLTATFELVFLTGWAPAPDQPKPLRPGSATTRLADALGVTERKAGDD
ncbi:methyltransferase domain-containing protein [Frigidibacter sp. ROC022]|uniref:methyltransferase domain-containing protein n=1 Tax=Frigidibacter sp. ROC022 TaxID=2971796 RepID=UPI00215B30FD|nr:methyltransferase domain-containing protein [Frigidibacter sp. ROC022]MCR8724441.1 methyltransferase domain-containing protein [Frigidibacter sp. ROC022]